MCVLEEGEALVVPDAVAPAVPGDPLDDDIVRRELGTEVGAADVGGREELRSGHAVIKDKMLC